MLKEPYTAMVGDIPWPDDPALQNIARLAGLLCFYRFPYFPLRYGEKGEAFAIRDAGYLITLRRLKADKAKVQIRWLAGVLAARGMPSWLLEVQLGYLERLLVRKGESAGILPVCHTTLSSLREQKISKQTLIQTGHRFAAALGLEPARPIRETGMLIAAAVADHQNGVASPASFLTWMTDPERFPDGWINAVRQTVDSLGGVER